MLPIMAWVMRLWSFLSSLPLRVPSAAQLDIAQGAAEGVENYIGINKFDYRNYGILDGIPEMKQYFAELLGLAPEEIINMEYLYAFMSRTEKHAYVVLRVADNDHAEKALEDAGFHLISDADVCKL